MEQTGSPDSVDELATPTSSSSITDRTSEKNADSASALTTPIILAGALNPSTENKENAGSANVSISPAFARRNADIAMCPSELDSAVLQDALSVRTGQRMVGTVFHRADEVVGGEGLEEEERQMRDRLGTRGPKEADWWTDTPSKPVKIRYGESGAASEPAMTVVELFEKVVGVHGSRIALGVKRAGEWKTMTYQEYYDTACIIAKAFIRLGLKPHHSVCILGFNAPEWHLTNMATIMAGGQTVGLYLTSTPEACFNVASSSDAAIIVVENDAQLQKILQVRDKLPGLEAIVQYTKQVTQPEANVFEWKDILSMGATVADSALQKRIVAIKPNMCCAIIYTSGTSGSSKGVLLSHDNLTWMSRRVREYVDCVEGEEHVISYLPLSHIAPQLLDIYSVLVTAGTCWFAQPDALKGSLLQTMKEVRPTIFLGVPRVWEKIAEGMQLISKNVTGLKAKLASWAKGVGLSANYNKQTGRSGTPFGWSLANAFFFKKVKNALGLDRCHFQMTGAAPTNEDTLTYFMSVNIPLYEIYGMSETTGPTTVTTVEDVRFCSVGKPFDGATIKIENPDEDNQGEVLINGRHLFMGYQGLPELTRDVFTQDGFLKSGDIGYLSDDGFLYITGRKKEIIITASGEKIAPVPVEAQIKQELPLISNAMVVGDQQKYISCLLTLKVVQDPVTSLPTNQLSEVALEACQHVGSTAKTVSDILEKGDHKVLKMIQKGIDSVNRKAISKVHKIAKWSIMERDFSVAGGELTPTLKLKRSVITFKYLESIDSFYT